MGRHLDLGGVMVDVVQKDIRNVHLSVHPPGGSVRISAPRRMSIETIRVFAISRLDWIKRQQAKLLEQERETQREYVDRESHYAWGKRYLLQVREAHGAAGVELTHTTMILRARADADQAKREAVLDRWYRDQIRAAIPRLLDRWQPIVEVEVERFFVRHMKTMWGSANHRARTIRLNTELAKKPPECLEYILVHELVHLLEPSHNARFVALMDRHMPGWQHRREALNRLPVRREEWTY